MEIVCLAISAYYFILFARIILSYVEAFASRPPDALRPVMVAVVAMTEPILAPLRRIIPTVGGLDLSPLVVFLILRVVQGQLC